VTTGVSGDCDPAFGGVQDAFARNFDERGELGAAVAVWLNGRLVVDLWGGFADPVEQRPWERDTIAHAYSVSKPIVATCALLLAGRGALDLDAPVARYWPEYAQAGKESTLVRHFLTHQAGLLVLREPQPPEALLDWERLVALLAAEPPLWEPGTRHGEHAAFFGHLVGEVVRRVDGRTLGRFLADELADPWELDFHIGLGPREHARAARLVDPGGRWRRSILDDPRRRVAASLDNPPGMLPAVNGHGTARSIARFYGGLAGRGELDGVKLLRSEVVDDALRPTHAATTSCSRSRPAGAWASVSTTRTPSASAGSAASPTSASAVRASRWATATSRACSPAASGPRPAKTLSMRRSRR
jgi:CubicO group peptidase (beta-lactamase class C family)